MVESITLESSYNITMKREIGVVETQRHRETRELLCKVLGRDLVAGDAEGVMALTQKPELRRILLEHTDELTAVMKAGREGQRSLRVLVDLVGMIKHLEVIERNNPSCRAVLLNFASLVAATDGQLVGVVELAKAAGPNAEPIILAGLPSVIDGLGGKITEGQLVSYGARLVDLANASGDPNQIRQVMRDGLPSVIEALGGNITEGQLGQLVRLAEASGIHRFAVINYGLTAVIKALGGKIEEGQLGRLVELAKESGSNVETVIRHGLPTVIEVLGSNITEGQLGSYGAKLVELAKASGNNVFTVIGLCLPAVIRALGGKITEDQLVSYGAKLVELANASGNNVFAVICQGLPTVIDALGGKITEGQLVSYGAKLVELANASGCKVVWVFRYGLPAVIKALGGKITEDQLVSYGAKLVELANASGSNMDPVFRQGLPAVIKALGGKITEDQLVSYGAKLVELAKASGNNVDTVFRHGLPTVIQGLGGKITERQIGRLVDLTVASMSQAELVIEHCLPAIIKVLGGKITEEQLGQLVDLAKVQCNKAIGEVAVPAFDLTGANQHLAGQLVQGQLGVVGSDVFRIAELVFSKDQGFETPKTEFASRISEWIGEELPVVIEVNDRSFDVSRIAGDGEWRVKGDKELDPGLYSKVCKVYLDAGKSRDAISSLWQIAGLKAPQCEPGSEAEKIAILERLRIL
jgi:hypothetical protein